MQLVTYLQPTICHIPNHGELGLNLTFAEQSAMTQLLDLSFNLTQGTDLLTDSPTVFFFQHKSLVSCSITYLLLLQYIVTSRSTIIWHVFYIIM